MEAPPSLNTPGNQNVTNKNKTIKLTSENNNQYIIDFLNGVNFLEIEAKSLNDMIPEFYTNKFTLQDIKKVKFFNDEYESIDECLSEIFDRLDKNESKLKIEKDELVIIVPLYSKKYPEIKFPLEKKIKSENEKYNELLDLFKKMKTEQEKEVKDLKDRINYLENLLKIKKNENKAVNDDAFKGTVVKIKCFGNNEFDNYFDTRYIPDINKIAISFSFICKNPKEISMAIDSFNRQKREAFGESIFKEIFAREKNNKIYIDCAFEQEKDPLLEDLEHIKYLNLFFGLGQSLTIKTKAIPKNLWEEFDEKKILKFILDSELEFENVSPQVQMFSFLFNDFLNSISWNVNDFTKALFRDIFLNLIIGNYKYKIPKWLIKSETKESKSDSKMIFDLFKDAIEFVLSFFAIDSFQDYEKIDFNEIEFYLVTQKHKSGFCFNFKCPEFNELVKYLVEEGKK